MAEAVTTLSTTSAISGSASNEEIIQGVASVLREASTALARLGGSPGPAAQLALIQQRGGETSASAASLAGAAAALAQAAAALNPPAAQSCSQEIVVASAPGELEPVAMERSPSPLGLTLPRVEPHARRTGGRGGARRADTPPKQTTKEFLEEHGLEDWVGEAIDMLTSSQRHSVLNPRLNVERARNPNGVVVSRIRQVASVQERIQIFIKVNDLAEGVVDRLSTLTDEQCEAVMETGMKIQKATNPSGVAMKRITEALRKHKGSGRGGPARLAPRRGLEERRGPAGAYRARERSRSLSWSRSRSRSSRRGRGRSPGILRGRLRSSHETRSGPAGGAVAVEGRRLPEDINTLVEDLGLETWCAEVLQRLSLYQRQTVVRELGNMRGVRNPSGVVMSRVKSMVNPDELGAIFVDLNGLDRACEEKLWSLTPEQRAAVIAPGIYVQNVRNPSTAVRSRIQRILDGQSAVDRPAHRPGGRGGKGGRGGGGGAARARRSPRRSRSPSSDASDSGGRSSTPRRRRRHR